MNVRSAKFETIGLYRVRHATRYTSIAGRKHDAMSGCNNAARGLLWGRRISARFQGATNTGPCATRETRRDSRGNDLVGGVEVGIQRVEKIVIGKSG